MRRVSRTLASSCLTLVLPLLLVAASGCGGSENGEDKVVVYDSTNAEHVLSEEFKDYWYAGVAELGRYDLKQARYGEIHEGNAVLIFVTEDFLAEKQVKLESEPEGREAPSVLKMNMVKKFLTGVYPYSMMTSAFTPVDQSAFPHTLKVSTSSQEWCGHTFTQLNRKEGGWHFRQFSYFEKEGDVEGNVEADLLEDEVWTRLRLDPGSIPTGEVSILPGTMTARLRHTPHVPLQAEIRRIELPRDTAWGEMERIMVEYTDPPRTLMINYQKAFPHRIISWSETYNDFGTVSTTTAQLADTITLDYWKRHDGADSIYREQLGF